MNFVFLADNLKFSGGRKTFLELAAHLKEGGHETRLLVLNPKGELADVFPSFEAVADMSPARIPGCDYIVATTPAEVKSGFLSGKASKKIVHFCQGFEIEDLENRISGKVTPPRYQGNGILKKLTLARKKIEWRRKIAELDKIYELDTQLIVISPHLKEVVEKRYGKSAELCRYGVKQNFFYPGKPGDRIFSNDNPCRIINVGPINVTFKGIPDTIEAVRRLKKEKIPVHFIRVSPDPRTGEDSDLNAVDEYHSGLSPSALGDLMRSSDIYISNSLEGEGFGLPAMEAMSSGLLCILSSISSYLAFDAEHDYALFVPERDPGATADAIRKILSMDPSARNALRKRAAAVSEKYSFASTMRQMEKIITSK